jgi:hypothetical protein
MRHDLVTIQVEVDPFVGATSLPAAEQLAIKAASSGEIVDWKGEMERRQAHAPALRRRRGIVEAFVERP